METLDRDILKPLEADSLARRAADTMRNYIVATGLKIGDRLPTERTMASAMLVNRATIRAALNMLQAEGLIARRKGCRPVISAAAKAMQKARRKRLERERVHREELRVAIEIGAAAYACQRRTNKHVRKLHAILNRWTEKHEQGLSNLTEDAAFHQVMLDAAGALFAKTYGQFIREHLRLTAELNIDLFDAYHDSKTLADHRKMVKALAGRDVATLTALLLPESLRPFSKVYPWERGEKPS